MDQQDAGTAAKKFFITPDNIINRGSVFDILLVEDNQTDTQLIRRTFERVPQPLKVRKRLSPFRVTAVPRLRDAVSLLGSQFFDAAVLDLNLLDANGISSLIELNSAAAVYTPIIVYSGDTDIDMQVDAVNCGAYCFLSKNIASTTELKVVVQEAVGFSL